MRSKALTLDIKPAKISKEILWSENNSTEGYESPRAKVKQSQLDEYKILLDKVTNKIDDWHKSIVEKRKGKFKRDEDFIDLQPSPTKFHSDCSSLSDGESLSKGSSPGGSPKLQSFARLDTSNLVNSRHRIRIQK